MPARRYDFICSLGSEGLSWEPKSVQVNVEKGLCATKGICYRSCDASTTDLKNCERIELGWISSGDFSNLQ